MNVRNVIVKKKKYLRFLRSISTGTPDSRISFRFKLYTRLFTFSIFFFNYSERLGILYVERATDFYDSTISMLTNLKRYIIIDIRVVGLVVQGGGEFTLFVFHIGGRMAQDECPAS